ncbi:serine/threonine protein kinase [Rhizobium giardinii]|uniref:serine/threonine protein kinase n=1 Tax=Rhizobium giardinii TaxID=56731 RepID=UPI003D6EA1F5
MVKPLYEFDEETRQDIIKMHLEMPRGGKVTGPIEGAYGEVYSIYFPASHFPRRIAAKCPRFRRFGKHQMARSGVEQVLHELEKTHAIFMVPWVNRFFDVQFIHGWPFILSRYRDGSLEDLIANPLGWSVSDRFASLIQIVRALRLAQKRGIAAHQDLKPSNVFFDDWCRKGVPKESKGLHFQMFLGDFGLADAFRDFGRNNGSRPYMAPEQFSASPTDSTGPASFDVFALGVIAFESFMDGQHPIGVTTGDVWPWRQGIPQKWNRESTWRDWAKMANETVLLSNSELPHGMIELIHTSLSPDPTDRPSLSEFEHQLWSALNRIDSDTCAGLRMQVEHLESSSSSDDEWPHMDEKLAQMRKFYATL